MPRPLVWIRRWRVAMACLNLAFIAAPVIAQIRTAGAPATGRAAVTAPNASPARSSNDPRLATFDPPTRMLIEMELRDAAPAEREEWLNLLGSVDRDQVPHLLEARRRATSGRVKLGGTPAQSQDRGRAASTPSQASAAANRGRLSPSQPPIATPSASQSPSPTMLGYGTSTTTGVGVQNPPAAAPAVTTAASTVTSPTPYPQVMGAAAPAPTATAQRPPAGGDGGAGRSDSPPASHGGFLANFRRDADGDRDVSQTAYLPTNGGAGPHEESSAAASIPPGAADEPAASSRRWMAPLRPLRGDAPRGAAAAVETRPSPPPAVNSNAEPRSSAYMNVELQRVMTLLRAEMEYGPSSGSTTTDREQVRRHIQKRLLHLLADEPDQAIQAIPGLPPAEQEFWTQMLWSLANELHPPAEVRPEQRMVRTAKLLAEAERHLRDLCPLEIHLACFCHKINSFGSYERFTRDEFRPGQPVLIYAELKNFTSELTVDAQYRTRLRTTMEIRVADAPADAPAVDRRDFPATEDFCRSPRHDYFHSYRVDIPQQLPAGRYLLRLGLVDEISGKATTTDLPFVVW